MRIYLVPAGWLQQDELITSGLNVWPVIFSSTEYIETHYTNTHGF
jgi:hypothetical protein